MRKLLDGLMRATRTYTVLDYGFLKIALISFGILVGAYFAGFFLKYIVFFWIVFIISYVYIAYRTLMAFKKE